MCSIARLLRMTCPPSILHSKIAKDESSQSEGGKMKDWTNIDSQTGVRVTMTSIGRVRPSEVASQAVGSCWVPFLDFESFDAFELSCVAGDEGGFQAAGLGSDKEIQGANDFACRF